MQYLTDAQRRARVIGAWEQRYREGTLPEADNHAAEFMVHHDSPDLLVHLVEMFVKSFLLKVPPPPPTRPHHP